MNDETKNLSEKVINGAKTTEVEGNFATIPFTFMCELAKVFKEGREKYGSRNYEKGLNSEEYLENRANHAYLHFLKYLDGDTSENHLAKVAWFCAMAMEADKKKKFS